MARPALRLRAVVRCDGYRCDIEGDVLIDLADLSIDLNDRSVERNVSTKLPEGWTERGGYAAKILCPKCSAEKEP